MTFLSPLFLWALAALSIPVIIHLFNFRRTRRVLFSNNRFLRQVQEVSTAKRKLRHYLILASRMLFLAFLVLAFAQPVIPAREQLQTGRNVLIYIDNSQSMSAETDEKLRGLDAAVRFGTEIVQAFPAETKYKILTNDFAPFSNTYKTRPEALDLLASLRLSSQSRTMEEVRARMLEEPGATSEIFWISDFQQSTLGKIPVNWDSARNWRLVPIPLAKAPNVFVDTAFLSNPFASKGEKNVLTVRVRNEGSAEAQDLNLRLAVNGVQEGTSSVDISPGGVAETSFDLTTALSGLNRGVISFNDFPVSFDNEFFMALNFNDKINVIEIKSARDVTPVEKVYGNESVFAFRSFINDNFNQSLLEDANLVVLNGIDQPDPSLSGALAQFVAQGGALLIVPGKNPGLDAYKTITGIASLKTVGQGALRELDKPDFGNPFFENVFEEQNASLDMPEAAPVLSWATDRNAILRFRDDAPFLSQPRADRAVFLLASPLQPGLSTFSSHALFVPVMYRLASSGKKEGSRLYFNMKESVVSMRIDSAMGEEPLKLSGSNEVVPGQRLVNRMLTLDIPRYAITPGFYSLMRRSDTLNLLAFNLDKNESVLVQKSSDVLLSEMGNPKSMSMFSGAGSDTFGNEIKERYLGKPLWKYALLLALFFLLAEVLLTRFLK